MLHVRQPAAEHDRVGVEEVDDLREAARQPVGVPRQRRPRRARRRPRRGPGYRVRRARPGRRSRAPARGPRATSRGSRAGRTSSAVRAAPRGAARAAELWPHSPRDRGGGLRCTRPSTTMPPPQPVPRMTPNTTRYPAPAPSAASLSAKQLASFSTRTSRPSSARRVAVERVAVERDRVGVLHQAGRRADRRPGCRCRRWRPAPSSRLGLRARGRRWRRASPRSRAGVGIRRRRQSAAIRRQSRDLDLGAAEVDADAVTRHDVSLARRGAACSRRGRQQDDGAMGR